MLHSDELTLEQASKKQCLDASLSNLSSASGASEKKAGQKSDTENVDPQTDKRATTLLLTILQSSLKWKPLVHLEMMPIYQCKNSTRLFRKTKEQEIMDLLGPELNCI